MLTEKQIKSLKKGDKLIIDDYLVQYITDFFKICNIINFSKLFPNLKNKIVTFDRISEIKNNTKTYIFIKGLIFAINSNNLSLPEDKILLGIEEIKNEINDKYC